MQAEIGSASAPAPVPIEGRDRRQRFWLRAIAIQLIAWGALIFCAVAQTWWTRHIIFSDGIAYLDIADNYAHGDWHNALNEYWSPLYSWILALILKLFHPALYWHVAMLHLVNLVAFCAALAFMELFIGELLQYRGQIEGGLSNQTIRIAGYASLFIAGLWHITTGYVSPDMITMAILFFIAYLQIRIARGRVRSVHYVLLGSGLALGFLSRAAFAPLLPLYAAVTAVSLHIRRQEITRSLLLMCASILLLAGPFVAALSAVKGHLTWGAAGPPNYAWEVDGAPRSVHWQGHPPELGKPKHPTRRVLDHPATYEFATPVAGTYPPWYEPSYWYEGISPRFQLRKQLSIIRQTTPYWIALFLASPIAIPCLALVLAGNWRAWVSPRGFLAYWFLWLPLLAYTALYVLVFMDKRYVGGALAILWICIAASITVSQVRLRRFANVALPALCVLFVAAFTFVRVRPAFAVTLKDALRGHETQWNLHWMVAERFRQLGVKEGDRIAFLGNAMDCEWARQLGARIVAEVPVIWDRKNTLSRGIEENYSEVDAFWHSPPATQARVLDVFRRAGASLVVAEILPKGTEAQGWTRLFPTDVPHLPRNGPQYDTLKSAGYLRIRP